MNKPHTRIPQGDKNTPSHSFQSPLEGKNAFNLAINFEYTDQHVPSEVELLPDGDVITGRDGRNWNNPNPQAIVDAFVTNKSKLPIDVEHATELKAPNGDPAPAVGWIVGIFIKDNSSIWGSVEWNNEGSWLLKDKRYRYLSPVFIFDPKTNNILRLTSAALTNNPNLFLTALNTAGNSNHQAGDTTMSKAICQSLGLDEGANEDNIIKAINTLKQDKKTALNAAKTPDVTLFIPKADHELALNRVQGAEDALAKIKSYQHTQAVDVAINTALEAGKIAPPASVDHYKATCKDAAGLTAFNQLVDTLPVIAPNSGLQGKQAGDETNAVLNAADKEAARMLGMSEDEFAKAKNAQDSTTNNKSTNTQEKN